MELEGDYEDIFLRCCKTAKTAAIFRPHASTLTFRTAATSHAGLFFRILRRASKSKKQIPAYRFFPVPKPKPTELCLISFRASGEKPQPPILIFRCNRRKPNFAPVWVFEKQESKEMLLCICSYLKNIGLYGFIFSSSW